MIYREEMKKIKEYKRIYRRGDEYGIVQWEEEQKAIIKKMDTKTIRNHKERMILKSMDENENSYNEGQILAKDTLLHVFVFLTTLILTSVFSFIDFIGVFFNEALSNIHISEEEFTNTVTDVLRTHLGNVLEGVKIVTNVFGGIYLLLIVGLCLLIWFKIYVKKNSLIRKRYYANMIKLFNKELKKRKGKDAKKKLRS